jgi:hypothetical protein
VQGISGLTHHGKNVRDATPTHSGTASKRPVSESKPGVWQQNQRERCWVRQLNLQLSKTSEQESWLNPLVNIQSADARYWIGVNNPTRIYNREQQFLMSEQIPSSATLPEEKGKFVQFFKLLKKMAAFQKGNQSCCDIFKIDCDQGRKCPLRHSAKQSTPAQTSQVVNK